MKELARSRPLAFGGLSFALLLAPLLHFLLFFGYPLHRPEVLLLAAAASATAAAIALVTRFLPFAGSLAAAVVLVHFVVGAAGITSDSVAKLLGTSVHQVETSPLSLVLYACGVVLVASALRALHERLLPSLSAAAGAVALATLGSGLLGGGYPRTVEAEDADGVDERLAPWIHIILDEQMGHGVRHRHLSLEGSGHETSFPKPSFMRTSTSGRVPAQQCAMCG